MDRPFTTATAITPSDTAKITVPHHGLFVGLATGDATTVVDLVVQFKAGTSFTFHKIPAGIILPITVERVMATGTTASLVVTALFRG
jgi:hypothetical protein